MQFRLTTTVDGLHLHGPGRDVPISLRVSHPRQMDVVISLEQGEGIQTYAERGLITATCSVEPNPRVAAGFDALARGELPEGIRPEAQENWHRFMDQDGKLQRNTLLPETGLPESMVSFIRAIRGDLLSTARRVRRLVRWRHALEGSHDPVRSVGLGPEWSLDGREWYLLPGNSGVRMLVVPTLDVTERTEGELQALVDSHSEEPVAHQLLREAMDVRNSNRRSSLVIGVAALEVGVKNTISELLPGAEWLVTNMPSPP